MRIEEARELLTELENTEVIAIVHVGEARSMTGLSGTLKRVGDDKWCVSKPSEGKLVRDTVSFKAWDVTEVEDFRITVVCD